MSAPIVKAGRASNGQRTETIFPGMKPGEQPKGDQP